MPLPRLKRKTISWLLLIIDTIYLSQDILLKLMFYQHIPYYEPLIFLMKWRFDTWQDIWLEPLVMALNIVFIISKGIKNDPTV